MLYFGRQETKIHLFPDSENTAVFWDVREMEDFNGQLS